MKNYSEYKEQNERSTEGFIFYTYNLYAVPGLNVSPHWHEEFEIIFSQTEGFLILDGKKIDFHKNDILFINPGQLHSTYHINPGWSYYIVVHPELFLSQNILNDSTKRFHFPEKLDSDDISYRLILNNLINIPAPISDAHKLLIMSMIFELLFKLTSDGYSYIENVPDITVQTGYVKYALNYIQQNLEHKITVQDIAGEIGISKEYLMRIFKIYTGKTINSYIQVQRLNAARNDLSDGYSVKDIVYKYNYSDISYFCKLFKKQYGISPGKIDKKEDWIITK